MNSTQRPPFLCLPKELRLRVYEEVFEDRQLGRRACGGVGLDHSRCTTCFQLNKDRAFLNSPMVLSVLPKGELLIQGHPTKPVRRTAILETCCFIHNEAVEVLYEQTPFIIGVQADPPECTQVVSPSLPPGPRLELGKVLYLSKIRHLYLRVDLQDSKNIRRTCLSIRDLFYHICGSRSITPEEVRVQKCFEEACSECPTNENGWHPPEIVVTAPFFRCRCWIKEDDGCSDQTRQDNLARVFHTFQRAFASVSSRAVQTDPERPLFSSCT